MLRSLSPDPRSSWPTSGTARPSGCKGRRSIRTSSPDAQTRAPRRHSAHLAHHARRRARLAHNRAPGVARIAQRIRNRRSRCAAGAPCPAECPRPSPPRFRPPDSPAPAGPSALRDAGAGARGRASAPGASAKARVRRAGHVVDVPSTMSTKTRFQRAIEGRRRARRGRRRDAPAPRKAPAEAENSAAASDHRPAAPGRPGSSAQASGLRETRSASPRAQEGRPDGGRRGRDAAAVRRMTRSVRRSPARLVPLTVPSEPPEAEPPAAFAGDSHVQRAPQPAPS